MTFKPICYQIDGKPCYTIIAISCFIAAVSSLDPPPKDSKGYDGIVDPDDMIKVIDPRKEKNDR
jgi:hypothetical protein